jgi:hypothetical protein
VACEAWAGEVLKPGGRESDDCGEPAKPGGWDGEEAVVRGRCRITGEQMRRAAALIS